ncbi:hypothetical protein DL765_004151 [Monosporascus sp. GIB2]|nr:hypothetical protein DL765_004151 [Monosporascus sp. GIB2]
MTMAGKASSERARWPMFIYEFISCWSPKRWTNWYGGPEGCDTNDDSRASRAATSSLVVRLGCVASTSGFSLLNLRWRCDVVAQSGRARNQKVRLRFLSWISLSYGAARLAKHPALAGNVTGVCGTTMSNVMAKVGIWAWFLKSSAESSQLSTSSSPNGQAMRGAHQLRNPASVYARQHAGDSGDLQAGMARLRFAHHGKRVLASPAVGQRETG